MALKQSKKKRRRRSGTVLTPEIIDEHLRKAAITFRETKDLLEHTARIPQSVLGLVLR